MKENQKGFSPIEGLLIAIVLGVIGLAGWYIINTKNQTNNTASNTPQAQQVQNISTNTYKILGTEDYICTKSIPAQCHGNIKVQSSGEAQKSVSIDKDTDFSGSDPVTLYKSDKSPLNAGLELDGNRVKSLKLL